MYRAPKYTLFFSWRFSKTAGLLLWVSYDAHRRKLRVWPEALYSFNLVSLDKRIDLTTLRCLVDCHYSYLYFITNLVLTVLVPRDVKHSSEIPPCMVLDLPLINRPAQYPWFLYFLSFPISSRNSNIINRLVVGILSFLLNLAA